MDSLDALEVLIALARAVCTETHIARYSGLIVDLGSTRITLKRGRPSTVGVNHDAGRVGRRSAAQAVEVNF